MKYCSLILIFLGMFNGGFSQRNLTLADAEKSMLANNLQLLAEQFNINASQAAVIQAKIWDRPYLSGEFNLVNPQDKEFFSVGNEGQKAVAVSQLIYLGGKKKNEIEFAKSNVAIAELQFEQLIRNLKLQLAQNFYGLYFDQKKLTTLDLQISTLDTMLMAYEVQAEKGNVAMKELVRLETLNLGLKNDRVSIQKEIIDYQQNLTVLTGLVGQISPLVDESSLINQYKDLFLTKENLHLIVLEKNIEYRTAQKISQSQELFLRWQKSKSIPDFNAGLSYDQRGGAFQNQINATVGLPIALWNSNKGNIKIAEAQLKQSSFNLEHKKLDLLTQLDAYYAQWQIEQRQMALLNKNVTKHIKDVYDGMVINFQRRNVSLIEFTDFMESYNNANDQMNEIKKMWLISCLNLNYITNSELFGNLK